MEHIPLAPVIAGSLPLFETLSHFFRLWSIKGLVFLIIYIQRLIRPALPTTRPTLLKSYPCRPKLTNRIFIPPTLEKKGLLPLYIDIHGGGFAFGDPEIDDEFCSAWAKRTGMLVVSLDYRKSPIHRYPVPVHDVIAMALAVIHDRTLPIDKSRVVMGGFSAGGTLALSACQSPELKGIVKAAVPFYPAVDWSTHPSEKFKLRLYKEHVRDSLASVGPAMSWGYIPSTQNRRDPLLSPIYASKDALPRWIFMVAPQYDILTRESRIMMQKLAGIKELTKEQEIEFEVNGYRWSLIMGATHSFTHSFRESKEIQAANAERCERIYSEIYEWLKNGPLAEQKQHPRYSLAEGIATA
ncbi:Alpha/Beta hydrolase protein [Bisporella sp. PMI_857]|nr:Alpha/Beta hydrolase protein [Bisporella sp. PMI_857]